MRRKVVIVLVFCFTILFSCGHFKSLAEVEKQVIFSGRTWVIESSDNSPRGPGANYFSDSNETAWVDSDGWLHLKIRKEGNLKKWVCSSVRSLQPAEYGIHRFYVIGDVGHLDKNVVLGLFLYRMDPKNKRLGAEVDIEFSTWGLPKTISGEYIPSDNNMQYVLWKPWKEPEEPIITDMACFNIQTSSFQCSTHILTWKPDLIRMDSAYGHLRNPSPENMMQSYVFSPSLENTIQIPQQENHMDIILNLWLNENAPFPSNKKEQEILIQYEFEPLQ